jgi:2OG-Fe(II) oxygenase superfamily
MLVVTVLLCGIAIWSPTTTRWHMEGLFVQALLPSSSYVHLRRDFVTPRMTSCSETDHVGLIEGGLAPPEPLASLSVGSRIRAFRASTFGQEPHDFEIQRVAMDPPIFFLRNVLTNDECHYLIDTSTNMRPAETVTPLDFASRKRCKVAWLSNEWTQTLAWSLGNLFLSQNAKSHRGSGVEDLQILEYEPEGEFVLHHDGTPRALTILYYLNGIGETWFPLADNTELKVTPRNKDAALSLCRYGTDQGITVGGDTLSIRPGDAVAFYNYIDDASGEINWKAIHAGLPVRNNQNKWVANHWFRHGGLCEEG